MASVFLSHSSHDKEAARRLAKDLRANRHAVWLDEWEIHVGECIHSKIEKGIQESDFLVLLLSSHAVASKWVDREWKAAHWNEVESNSVALLPVLLEPCDIPMLLRTKKYADCTHSYEHGMRDLLDAMSYFESLKSDRDFFRAIPTVWAEERNLDDIERRARNRHWDQFENLVQSLPQADKGTVQAANSVYYLRKYGLTTSQLKEQLSRFGSYSGAINDDFDEEVTDALLEFQASFNLRHIDGIFGPLTYLVMAEAAKNIK
ncbi:MAG TPA: TIR domain-containing protein [Thermoanaerobaculia bacterium]|nr:TIR domain-containing protein [Thermoanaerobaculia bacterium]